MAKMFLMDHFSALARISSFTFAFHTEEWGECESERKAFPTCSGVDDGRVRFASWASERCEAGRGEERLCLLSLWPCFPVGWGLRGVLWTDWRKQGQGRVCVYESKISRRVFESHGGPFFLFSLSKFTSQRKEGRRERDVADGTLSQTQTCPEWEDRVETLHHNILLSYHLLLFSQMSVHC